MKRAYELLAMAALLAAMCAWLLFLGVFVGAFCGYPHLAAQFETGFRVGLVVFGVLYTLCLLVSVGV